MGFAQVDGPTIVRPKYVRRRLGPGEAEGGDDGSELGLWVTVGVAISRLISGEGLACALCRRFRRKQRSKVKFK